MKLRSTYKGKEIRLVATTKDAFAACEGCIGDADHLACQKIPSCENKGEYYKWVYVEDKDGKSKK